MLIQVWTHGYGFKLRLTEFPKFALMIEKQPITIYTSCKELEDLKQQIEDLIVEFKRQQKERSP